MRLGEYYARAIHDNFGLDFDVVFGPAYKGMPLSVVTAIAMHKLYGNARYCSDRKEVKDTTAPTREACWATELQGTATAW